MMNQNQNEKYKEDEYSKKFESWALGENPNFDFSRSHQGYDSPSCENMWLGYLAAKRQNETEIERLKEQLEIAEAVLSVQVTNSAMKYFEDKAKQLLGSEG